jgi:hypothetical protein
MEDLGSGDRRRFWARCLVGLLAVLSALLLAGMGLGRLGLHENVWYRACVVAIVWGWGVPLAVRYAKRAHRLP